MNYNFKSAFDDRNRVSLHGSNSIYPSKFIFILISVRNPMMDISITTRNSNVHLFNVRFASSQPRLSCRIGLYVNYQTTINYACHTYYIKLL